MAVTLRVLSVLKLTMSQSASLRYSSQAVSTVIVHAMPTPTSYVREKNKL